MDNRPDGTPFWGEARDVTEDWSLLAGTVDWWNGAALELNEDYGDGALSRVRFWGEGVGGTFDDYMIGHAGFSGVWMCWGAADTYLDLSDNAASFQIYWMVRARGAGSITAFDDYDLAWTYSLPANSLGTQAISGSVSSGPWTEYHFTSATPYTIEQLMSDDGGVCRFGINITGASVAIDQIQMRVYPASGVLGGWRSKSATVVEDNAVIWQVSAAPGNDDTNVIDPEFWEFDYGDDGGAGQLAAWDDFKANIAVNRGSGNPLWEYTSTPLAGWGYASSVAASDVKGSLGATEHIGRFTLAYQYMVVHTESVASLVSPNPSLDEEQGVDFIRRPDRIPGDLKQYYSYPLDSTVPSVTGWINDTVHVSGFRFVYGPMRADDGSAMSGWPDGTGGGQGENYVSLNIESYVTPPPPEGRTPPAVPVPYSVAGTHLVMNDVSGGGDWTADDIAVDLPAADGFILTVGNTFSEQHPPIHEIPHVVSQFTGATVAQHVTFYFGNWQDSADSDAWLKALITIPPYLVWDPGGTEPSWVRQAQRGDGLGGRNPRRGRSRPTYQGSIRGRGSR